MFLLYIISGLVAFLVGIRVSIAMLAGRMSLRKASLAFGAAVTISAVIFGLSQQVDIAGLVCIGSLSLVLISGWMFVLGYLLKQKLGSRAQSLEAGNKTTEKKE